MDNQTLVYLTDEIAGKFVLFQKYFVPFNVLVDSRFFDQRAATLVTRIDKEGVIRDISRTDLLYSLGLNIINTNDGLTTLFVRE